MKLEANSTLLLFGPGSFESDIEAEIFGGKFRKAKVEEGKILPVFFKDDAKVSVSGDYIIVNGSTIPESWRKFAKNDYRRVFLFGESDSGKSSFSTFVVNTMSIERVIDADVGQNDIAHPGSMALGEKKEEIYSLKQLSVLDVAFTGVISPSGFESRCLKAFSSLVKKAGDRYVVDTTGWVKGWRAREYKLAKIEVSQPDVIACFGEIPYYLEDSETVRIESFVVKKRDREMRANIRGRRYEEWLKDLDEIELSVDEIKLKNTTLFKGEKIRDNILGSFGDVIYAEKGYDFLNIYSEDFDAGKEAIAMLREVYGVVDINVVRPSDIEGLFLGLRKEGKYVSPGLLKGIDFEQRKIKILGKRNIDTIEFGNFKLNHERKEVVVRIP